MPSFKAKHAVLRPAKPAFAPLNMPFCDPQNRLLRPSTCRFQNPNSPVSRVPTGFAAIFVPAALFGCRRVSPLFIPARSARAHVIKKVHGRGCVYLRQNGYKNAGTPYGCLGGYYSVVGERVRRLRPCASPRGRASSLRCPP